MSLQPNAARVRAKERSETQRHAARLASDPDLKELVADAAKVEQLRKNKSQSLNLAARRAERDSLDAERLGLINARRAAHGQEPYKSLEDVKPDEQPDPNLSEAARIAVELGESRATASGASAAAAAPPAHGTTKPLRRLQKR